LLTLLYAFVNKTTHYGGKKEPTNLDKKERVERERERERAGRELGRAVELAWKGETSGGEN